MTQTQERRPQDSRASLNELTSLAVHVEPGDRAARRIAVAATLARESGARLIGVGAEMLEPFPATGPYSSMFAADLITAAQEQINSDLKSAEEAFRREAAGAEIEWRATQDYPDRALARTARAADLLVVSPKSTGGPYRCIDPADLVMRAGRPVLLVPEGHERLRVRTAVVGWKDTREARRAVADALPLLKRAEEVIVQAVCETEMVEEVAFQTEDVASALRRHRVAARAEVLRARSDEAPETLARIVRDRGADLLVVGAYGHSRMSEWVFGGVTRSLLQEPPCFVQMSH